MPGRRESLVFDIGDVFAVGSNALTLQAVALGGEVPVYLRMTRNVSAVFAEQVGREQVGCIATGARAQRYGQNRHPTRNLGGNLRRYDFHLKRERAGRFERLAVAVNLHRLLRIASDRAQAADPGCLGRYQTDMGDHRHALARKHLDHLRTHRTVHRLGTGLHRLHRFAQCLLGARVPPPGETELKMRIRHKRRKMTGPGMKTGADHVHAGFRRSDGFLIPGNLDEGDLAYALQFKQFLDRQFRH